MSDDGRGKRAERVTLKFQTPPLRLPGEAEGDEAAGQSAELRLPSAEELEEATGRSSSARPRGEGEPRARDGWERQRRSATPPPMRYVPPVEVPSPPVLPSEEGDALSLVDKRSRPSIPVFDPAAEMSERFALGDFSAALRVAELILGHDPDDEAARVTACACRERLVELYGSRLGSMASIPHPNVEGAEVRWLGLDNRAGFLLSLVNGEQSISELIDVSGMPRLEVLKTLVELLDMGALRFRE